MGCAAATLQYEPSSSVCPKCGTSCSCAAAWIRNHERVVFCDTSCEILRPRSREDISTPELLCVRQRTMTTDSFLGRAVKCAAISPCGEYATMAMQNKAIILSLTASPMAAVRRSIVDFQIKEACEGIVSIKFSPCGTLIVCGISHVLKSAAKQLSGTTRTITKIERAKSNSSGLGEIALWDAQSGTCRRRFRVQAPIISLSCFAGVSGGLFVFLVDNTATISLWDSDDDCLVLILDDSSSVECARTCILLAVSPCAKFFALSTCGDAKVWSTLKRAHHCSLKGSDGVTQLVYSASGSALVGSLVEHCAFFKRFVVFVWDAASGDPILRLPLPSTEMLACIAVAPSHPLFAVGLSTGRVRIWNFDGVPLATAEPDAAANALPQPTALFFRDEKRLVCIGSTLAQFELHHADLVESLPFLPEFNPLFGASSTCASSIVNCSPLREYVELWKRSPVLGPQRSILGIGRPVWCAAFSRCTKYLVCGHPASITVWELATQELIQRLPIPANDTVRSVGFSPCGDYVAGGTECATLFVFSVLTGDSVHTVEVNFAQPWAICGAAFSECGLFVACASGYSAWPRQQSCSEPRVIAVVKLCDSSVLCFSSAHAISSAIRVCRVAWRSALILFEDRSLLLCDGDFNEAAALGSEPTMAPQVSQGDWQVASRCDACSSPTVIFMGGRVMLTHGLLKNAAASSPCGHALVFRDEFDQSRLLVFVLPSMIGVAFRLPSARRRKDDAPPSEVTAKEEKATPPPVTVVRTEVASTLAADAATPSPEISTDAPSPSQAKRRKHLGKKLKAWKATFAAENGRAPKTSDIKKDPSIAEIYEEYSGIQSPAATKKRQAGGDEEIPNTTPERSPAADGSLEPPGDPPPPTLASGEVVAMPSVASANDTAFINERQNGNSERSDKLQTATPSDPPTAMACYHGHSAVFIAVVDPSGQGIALYTAQVEQEDRSGELQLQCNYDAASGGAALSDLQLNFEVSGVLVVKNAKTVAEVFRITECSIIMNNGEPPCQPDEAASSNGSPRKSAHQEQRQNDSTTEQCKPYAAD